MGLSGTWPRSLIKLNDFFLEGGRVNSFAAYAYGRRICPLEFFIVLRLKNNEHCDGYTYILLLLSLSSSLSLSLSLSLLLLLYF